MPRQTSSGERLVSRVTAACAAPGLIEIQGSSLVPILLLPIVVTWAFAAWLLWDWQYPSVFCPGPRNHCLQILFHYLCFQYPMVGWSICCRVIRQVPIEEDCAAAWQRWFELFRLCLDSLCKSQGIREALRWLYLFVCFSSFRCSRLLVQTKKMLKAPIDK